MKGGRKRCVGFSEVFTQLCVCGVQRIVQCGERCSAECVQCGEQCSAECRVLCAIVGRTSSDTVRGRDKAPDETLRGRRGAGVDLQTSGWPAGGER